MLTSNDMPLASKPIDRAAHRRRDDDWLEKAFRHPDVLVFLMQNGQPMLEGSAGPARGPGAPIDRTPRRLLWLGQEAAGFSAGAKRIFMGEDRHGSPIFALCVGESFALDGTMLQGAGAFEDMRTASAGLPALEANLASTARSISEWHRTHGFCARCGSPTEIAEAGWKRICPACDAEHFPRTDPVAIMLPILGDECLLGRSKGWPDGFWSCLAGFVEPGETIEQAACREVQEEAGVICNPENAEYLFCQPWPFPSSLMMGVHLKAETREIEIDPNEIEAARWFSRDEVRSMLAGEHPDAYCPPEFAIAHFVIREWAQK